jgi:hypothetical protein
MESLQVINVIQRLHLAAQHPAIVSVARYGRDSHPGGQSPSGVAITYQWGSTAYLWPALPSNPAPQPVDLPAEPPPFKLRAPHAIVFCLGLLDAAQPAEFTAWRPVSFGGVAMSPAGIELRGADGTNTFLRCTSGSGPTGDPTEDPHPDYVIPDSITSG